MAGCCYASQFHPTTTAADHSPRTVACSVPTWCCLQSHCSTHQRGHCCKRRWVCWRLCPQWKGVILFMISLRQVPDIAHIISTVLFSIGVFFVSTALATLKPQAGLVAPQAVSAAQPAAAVSYNLHNSKLLIMILRKTFLCLYLRVLVESLWRLMNRWEWLRRSSRR